MKTMNLDIQPIQSWIPNIQRPLIISGPCSAESEEQVITTASLLAETGKVDVLRAGIWKPRTRPGSFEGVGSVGLKWLQAAKKETGLPVAVEVANVKHVYEALKHGVDILWLGARTTVNPFSVQEIADALQGVDAIVLVKNPINPDLNLWIGAIERIAKAGITRIGAIHRGFSKYGPSKYRNEPNWQIPIDLMRTLPELPMICDPSHISGNRELLAPVSQKALDLNFHGLMIESHVNPSVALSDAKQQVTPVDFNTIVDNLILRDTTLADNSNPLGELRSEIDRIDDELLSLLAGRMQVSRDIGEFKKANNLTILQAARWEDILQKAIEKGVANGLSKEFIAGYLKSIHLESINQQTKVMNGEGVVVAS